MKSRLNKHQDPATGRETFRGQRACGRRRYNVVNRYGSPLCARTDTLSRRSDDPTKRKALQTSNDREKREHFYRMGQETNILHTHGTEDMSPPFIPSSGITAILHYQKVIPHDSGGELGITIEKLTRTCESCRKFSKKPFRFRAALPPDLIFFNH